MFPYPSGEGLHVGHPKGYIASDVYARYKRMSGYSVLHPMGWDAFGLPAENYALEHKVHPQTAVAKNIARFKEQLQHIGFDYDWKREINTTDPSYYKWTQWIFLQLFKKGLAYQSNEPINWCPSCKTGLANEDLEGGACERCGTTVEQKKIPQWVLKITDYADRLLSDLDTLPWSEHIKELQRNWIGKSEGAEIDFLVSESDIKIKIFTTRPDTLFGATYMVLAPEHPLVVQLMEQAKNKEEVSRYVALALKKTPKERAENKEKTGVELRGVKAINPGTKEEIPIFVADYVLEHVGTGAIMAVPAHDERDFEFAKKFNLPVRHVVESTESSILSNSGNFDGMDSEEAKKKITDAFGVPKTTYKLRDWVFSRQRYWGEPIPVIHCKTCGVVPVPEKDLPVLLPKVTSYEPSGTGESPLATMAKWVNTKCPECGEKGRRETNTMPQWAGSSWYYLRYMDPDNTRALVFSKKEKYWAPVDTYVGGIEHATRHLIYARFWHKFLFDMGVVSTSEPFQKLHTVGLVLAEDGRKMSKRYKNTIDPDDVIKLYGADSLRLYEMFMGPFENTITWNTNSLIGVRRFVERVWRLQEHVQNADVSELQSVLHRTVKKVGEDIGAFKFNTAISTLMIFLNAVEKERGIGKSQWKSFLKLLSPFAPHIADELWSALSNKKSIHVESWPTYEEKFLTEETVIIALQINGKTRGETTISTQADTAEYERVAREALSERLKNLEVVRVVVVPKRLVNIVVKVTS